MRARQLAEALEQALASLPLKKRQAYVWHRLEGYSQPEIAQRMGLALNTVERYIMDLSLIHIFRASGLQWANADEGCG